MPSAPRQRHGYKQPNRSDRVGLIAYVQPGLRTEFNALAKVAGMTTQDFLAEVAEKAVNNAKQNPDVAKLIEAQAQLSQRLNDRVSQLAALQAAIKNPVTG